MLLALTLCLTQTASAAPLTPAQAIALRSVGRDSTHDARSVMDVAGDDWTAAAESEIEPRTGAWVQWQPLANGAPGGPSALQSGAGASSTGAISGAATVLPQVYQVQITVPGAGQERFLFQEAISATPRPLLVVFHKFGVSHFDALAHTSFFGEARRRGWYCIAPASGGQQHFSSLTGQARTRAALNWAASNFALDSSRIYAVGFSMGGGAALNYATRHLDPREPMFAAVFNISGIASHVNTYIDDIGVRPTFDVLFGSGAVGSATAFGMNRSSLLSFDPNTLSVYAGSDLARNLMHIKTRTALASGDIPYLVVQNTVLHNHLQGLGATPGQHDLVTYTTPANYHSWDLLPEQVVCDWLRPQRLSIPQGGNTLFDTSGRYFHFDCEQQVAGDFSSMQWKVLTASNSLDLISTFNVLRTTVDVQSAGLDPSSAMSVRLSAADNLSDEVVLTDWPSSPTVVLRDGVVSTQWSHDALSQTLTLSETDASTHVWDILP